MKEITLLLIQAFSSQGPLGLAVLTCFASMVFCLGMGWFYHTYKTNHLEERLQEIRQDKDQLMELVKSNTQSINKNTSALENNTAIVRNCITLIHRMFERLHGIGQHKM